MKKVKLTGKLSLNKETVAKLNNEQMGAINGGITYVTLNGYTCVVRTKDVECHQQSLWNMDTCQSFCTIDLPTIL